MTTQLINVDRKPFLGRVEEQKQFRAALKDVLEQPKNEKLPYIFLLYGDGGIGKTTLSKRFRDISKTEIFFEEKFQIMWVDFEDERKRFTSLQVGREFITPESLFDVIFTVAEREGWGKYFTEYRKAVDQRKIADKKAAEVLSAVGDQDQFSVLRGVSAGALASVIRIGLPAIGSTGENLAKAFLEIGIKVGAEQAAVLRTSAETRLKARLGVEQFDLYINPNEGLARALADGLKRTTLKKPLIVFLDTYEIVDRADIWLRMVMQTAGPNLIWVVSGRDNLVNSRQFGRDYFKGYAEEFSRRLITFDVHQLALEDVKSYFAACASGRQLEPEAVDAICRATRGIPLAIEQAADMWIRGVSLENIVGDTTDATPQKEIVNRMTGRYLLHVITEEDKTALYALTLARGDVEVLREMLRPAGSNPYDLESLLHRLERDYSSVYAGENRLHDEPNMFFYQYLKTPMRRTSFEIKSFIQRAIVVLQNRLSKLEENILTIENRCKDNDWVKIALDLTYYYFWLDEDEGWKWLAPRFLEARVYSRDLERSLIKIAADWKDELSQHGQKTLKALRVANFWSDVDLSDEKVRLLELERMEQLGWFAGTNEIEHCAILDFLRGKLLLRDLKYIEALEVFERSEWGMPDGSQILKEQLAEGYEDIGWHIGFHVDNGYYYALPVEEAERVYEKAIVLGRETCTNFKNLGDIQAELGRFYGKLNKYDEALAAHKKAIELDPNNANPWDGKGFVYRMQGKYDEALAAYNKAIELDPKIANSWNGKGFVYRMQGKYDDALAAYKKAIELDPKYAFPWNGIGNVYRMQGKYDDALISYKKAIELDSNYFNAYMSLGSCYKKIGCNTDAEKYLKIAGSLIEKEHEYNRACYASITGEIEKALNLLKIAIEKESHNRGFARFDPDFEFIRDDPRFKELVGEEGS